jgi:hypothetical protein
MSARTAIALLLLGGFGAASAVEPTDYARVFPLALDGAASGAWRIELTPEVYALLQDPALGDIEVFDASGTPMAVARVESPPAAPAARQMAVPVLDLPRGQAEGAPDLRVVIEQADRARIALQQGGAPQQATRDVLLDLRDVDQPAERLLLDWRAPASGVVARFALDASDDLQRWRPLGTATVLSLQQDGARLERRDIALSGNQADYLRLRRLDDGAPLEGLRAMVQVPAPGEPPRQWIEATASPEPLAVAGDEGAVTFAYTLAAPLPVDMARVALGGTNRVAAIDLSASVPDRDRPLPLASFDAFRIDAGSEPVRNGDVRLAPTGTRLERFTLRIRPPLATPPRLELGYRPHTLVFLADGTPPYRLAAGSGHARHAAYPVGPALAALRARLGKDWQPPRARVLASEESGGTAALQPARAPIPWQRWLLWTILLGGAALVAGLALSLLRTARREE